MDQISLSRINQLHPKIRKEVKRIYLEEVIPSLPDNVMCRITQGVRTKQEQDALYAQGRTVLFDNTGKRLGKVTNAKFGQSFHNYGFAIDFVLLIDKDRNGTFESVSWKVDSIWMTVINIFKKHGWKSGADFKSFKDYPHLEKTFGYTWQQMKALYDAGNFDNEGYIVL